MFVVISSANETHKIIVKRKGKKKKYGQVVVGGRRPGGKKKKEGRKVDKGIYTGKGFKKREEIFKKGIKINK